MSHPTDDEIYLEVINDFDLNDPVRAKPRKTTPTNKQFLRRRNA